MTQPVPECARPLFLITGSLLALMAVAAGAFAAHALKAQLSAPMLEVFRTGAEYQMYHALALVAVGMLQLCRGDDQRLRWSGRLFVVGTVLFSGSLYALATTGISRLGMITPVGGTAFIAGWAVLAAYAWRPSADD